MGDVDPVGEAALHECDVGLHLRIGELAQIVERAVRGQHDYLHAQLLDDLLVLLAWLRNPLPSGPLKIRMVLGGERPAFA